MAAPLPLADGAAAARAARSRAARLQRTAGVAALSLATLFVGLFVLHVLRFAPPAALSRAAAVGAVLAGLLWGGLRVATDARARGAAALVLPALLLLSLLVRFTGLSHEVEGRYYADEGTYYHHARGIETGTPLRLSFTYPHLLYNLDAVALWLLRLFPGAADALGDAFGFQEPLSVPWLVLRGVVALLSALTVVPAFRIGERLGGAWAGTVGGLLLVFSPLYNAGSHLHTCDVPSAFFATLCMLFVSRLVDEETTRDYLLAGMAAGLAAAAKYPAGVVAVAIVAVWLRWRFAHRNWRWGLLWAGLTSIATVCVVMPSLVAFPGPAFTGPRGMLFGYRQYGRGGWLGVMPESNVRAYGHDLLASFGVLAVAVGLAGVLLLAPAVRRRWLWHLPFPLVYLGLVSAMHMVVKRNLYPAVPTVAVLLGVGIAACLARLRGVAEGATPAPGTARLRAATAVLAAAACLAAPVVATGEQTIAMTLPSTRDVAAAWITANLPPGTSIVKEGYTPRLPEDRFEVRHLRFVTRLPMGELRRFDYLLLASASYGRFGDPEALFQSHQERMARRYEEIFDTFELVQEWPPSATRLGPLLRLYKPTPPPSPPPRRRRGGATGAGAATPAPAGAAPGAAPATPSPAPAAGPAQSSTE